MLRKALLLCAKEMNKIYIIYKKWYNFVGLF